VQNLYVPDFLILPFGHAVKSDLRKILLSAVSADGLYFSTDVPVIFIRKSDKRPLCFGDFELYFGDFPDDCYHDHDRNGDNLIAVEIDGAEPAGYAKDIRRDRLLRRAGVDVIHITNFELAKHEGRALGQLLSRQFFGFDWNYEGARPMIIPF
jgi:hypothetical protein